MSMWHKKTRRPPATAGCPSSSEEAADGKYTVVMAVRMSSRMIRYVELPVENAAGAFVFSDYPYWDESE